MNSSVLFWKGWGEMFQLNSVWIYRIAFKQNCFEYKVSGIWNLWWKTYLSDLFFSDSGSDWKTKTSENWST